MKLIDTHTHLYLEAFDQDRDQVIKTFSQMLSYENYIIANSSFSYMAAHLGSSENSKVLYPEPWFLNKSIKFIHKIYFFTFI